jgi:hypothetical protein
MDFVLVHFAYQAQLFFIYKELEIKFLKRKIKGFKVFHKKCQKGIKKVVGKL